MSADAPPPIDALLETPLALTRYRRAGRGAPVLLLSAEPLPPTALSDALAAAVRTYVPAVTPDRGGVRTARSGPVLRFDLWLGDLLDGLGLDRPALLADRGFARAALRFAARHTERVSGVAIAGSDACSERRIQRARARGIPVHAADAPVALRAMDITVLIAFLRDPSQRQPKLDSDLPMR